SPPSNPRRSFRTKAWPLGDPARACYYPLLVFGGPRPMQRSQLGKYRIVDKIGQGAMGEVYKAHDPVLNRFVAIKTITTSLGGDEQFRKRFQREAQSVAQLNHRNVVTVYDFDNDKEQGLVYLVMELLEGTDLKDVIARRALPRIEDKLSVLDQ